MDHHIQRIVQRHIETKFVKINAEKAPFFVEKLKVRSMPTLVYFVDGVAVGKLIGFEGLADNMPEGKEDEWSTIVLSRELGSKGMINKELIVDDDGVEAEMKAKLEKARQQSYLKAMQTLDLEDDDFEDFDT
jgi:thioredoxin-like negative regulator of GroEL